MFYEIYLKKSIPVFLSTLIILLITVSLFTFFMPLQNASAMIDVGWDFSTGHNLGDGATPIGSVPNLFNVTDDASEPNGVFNTTQVTVSSIAPGGAIKDSITMTLFEVDNPNPPPFGLNPDANTGIFVPTNIVFNPDTARFSIGESATVTQQDAAFAGNGILDTIPLQVNSTTTPGGIQYFLKETGPNTGIFTGHLKFSSGPSISNSTIQVSPGDIVTISYLGIPSNVAIVPSPNGSVSGLKADVGDTIRVSYKGHTADTIICTCGGPGGGGGGLIRPGLVLDALLGIGGSPFIVTPPSFGGGLLHYSDGLTIVQNDEKKTFDISKYNQDVNKQVLVAGIPVNMTLKMYDPYNINAIIHSGLYLIPSGSDMITTNSIASIVYDKNSKIEINDPTHLFTNASVTPSNDGKFQYVSFHFIPARSYEKMSFLNRAWNDHKYSTDVRFYDASIPSPKLDVLPMGFTKYDNFHDLIALIDKEGFEKPQIMAHIHSGTDIFPSNEGGYVYWLYDSTKHAVTLIISDKEGNTLYSFTEPLLNKEIQPKGDYGFMKFTVKQLNRKDVAGEQEVMKQEEAKAMEKEMITNGYHQENGIWVK